MQIFSYPVASFEHLLVYLSTDIYWFLPINYIIVHMTVQVFVWCVNGTEISKYQFHPYTSFKCLNVVRMSIFNEIFLYILPTHLYWNKEKHFK